MAMGAASLYVVSLSLLSWTYCSLDMLGNILCSVSDLMSAKPALSATYLLDCELGHGFLGFVFMSVTSSFRGELSQSTYQLRYILVAYHRSIWFMTRKHISRIILHRSLVSTNHISRLNLSCEVQIR